jgi:hypothetical protein
MADWANYLAFGLVSPSKDKKVQEPIKSADIPEKGWAAYLAKGTPSNVDQKLQIFSNHVESLTKSLAVNNDFKKDRVLLPRNLIPTHYNLEITPDFDKLEFIGDESITVKVVAETNQVQLHAKEITILEASFKSSDQSVSMAEISYNFKMTVITITFESAVLPGSGSLIIK